MFKGMFAPIGFLLLGGAAAAQTADAPQPAQSPTAAAVCALPDVAVSAELNQIPNSNLVAVPVEINGKPKNFLLSAGSAPSTVSSATVSELKLIEGIKQTETLQVSPMSQDETHPMITVGATMSITMVDARNSQGKDGRPRV